MSPKAADMSKTLTNECWWKLVARENTWILHGFCMIWDGSSRFEAKTLGSRSIHGRAVRISYSIYITRGPLRAPRACAGPSLCHPRAPWRAAGPGLGSFFRAPRPLGELLHSSSEPF